MKIVWTILMLAILAGCTAEQKKVCAFCRFVDGIFVCPTTQPSDANEIKGVLPIGTQPGR
jgi:hypothetical protein